MTPSFGEELTAFYDLKRISTASTDDLVKIQKLMLNIASEAARLLRELDACEAVVPFSSEESTNTKRDLREESPAKSHSLRERSQSHTMISENCGDVRPTKRCRVSSAQFESAPDAPEQVRKIGRQVYKRHEYGGLLPFPKKTWLRMKQGPE